MKTFMTNSILFVAVLVTATALHPGEKDKNSPPKMEAKVVDSGSFGIYVNGKRVGTETFKIEQRPDFHIATAEVKVDDGAVKSVQTAEMQISPTGDLHSYVWRATFPIREESSVEPNNQLLVEHVIPADLKKIDVPHLLPVSTAILDDNFFSQREILLWRYLATCLVKDQGHVCGTSSFAVLVPRQHVSLSAAITIVGPDKLTLKGSVRELTKVALLVGDPQHMIVINGDRETPGQWFLWVDAEDHYKVVKMAIPSSNVEIIRD